MSSRRLGRGDTKSVDEGATECNLIILIEYQATKTERKAVQSFLIRHLLARTENHLLDATVYLWDITKSHAPKPTLHPLTDVMGMDSFALTILMAKRKEKDVELIVSKVRTTMLTLK